MDRQTKLDVLQKKTFAEGLLLGLVLCTISSLIAIHLLLSFPKECTKSEETQQILNLLSNNLIDGNHK